MKSFIDNDYENYYKNVEFIFDENGDKIKIYLTKEGKSFIEKGWNEGKKFLHIGSPWALVFEILEFNKNFVICILRW